MKSVHLVTFSVLVVIIVLLLLGKESYVLVPNTIGGTTPYPCAAGPGITDTKFCQATTKEVAEAKCNSLPDCAGYSFFKGDPRKWGGGITTTQLVGLAQLKPGANTEWDFYKKGPAPAVVSTPALSTAPIQLISTSTTAKQGKLNQGQLNTLLQGGTIQLTA
jgi:hypothetical protein